MFISAIVVVIKQHVKYKTDELSVVCSVYVCTRSTLNCLACG